MRINIKTKGELILTDELKAYVETKAEHLEKYFKNYEDEDAVFVEFELSEGEPEKERKFRADIVASTPHDRTHAVGWGETIFAALDEAKDELSRRLRREKKKRIALLKKAGRKIKDMIRGFKS